MPNVDVETVMALLRYEQMTTGRNLRTVIDDSKDKEGEIMGWFQGKRRLIAGGTSSVGFAGAQRIVSESVDDERLKHARCLLLRHHLSPKSLFLLSAFCFLMTHPMSPAASTLSMAGLCITRFSKNGIIPTDVLPASG